MVDAAYVHSLASLWIVLHMATGLVHRAFCAGVDDYCWSTSHCIKGELINIKTNIDRGGTYLALQWLGMHQVDRVNGGITIWR